MSGMWSKNLLQTTFKSKNNKGGIMEDNNKFQEMQILEQNLQSLLFQKQAFQMELSETKTALGEIEKAGEEVFKIVGQLMIKANKSKVKEDLENKEKLLSLRLQTLEKQETAISEKIEAIREEVLGNSK